MEQIQEQVRVQRKDRRFLVHDRTLAQVGLAPGVLFHIIDISRGGLAFRYLGDHELAMNPTELDIIRDEQFALSKIPVKPVSDCPLAYGYIPMRRRSVQFGELTPWQKAELEHFLQNCVGTEIQ